MKKNIPNRHSLRPGEIKYHLINPKGKVIMKFRLRSNALKWLNKMTEDSFGEDYVLEYV